MRKQIDDFPGDKFSSFVRAVIDIARHRMHLQEWAINLRYSPKDKREKKSRVYILATTIVQPTYIDCTITIYPRLQWYFDEKDYWSVSSTVCHELSHCLTQRFYDLALEPLKKNSPVLDHEWELLTSRISNMAVAQVWADVQKINHNGKGKT